MHPIANTTAINLSFSVVLAVIIIFFILHRKNINFSKIILSLSCILVIFLLWFAFCAPNLFIEDKHYFTLNEAANISMSIGSLMSPFIAIAAAILTFMAFWVQYNANQEMLKRNAKQEIEHQFFEMLHIHKENVKELTWEQWSIIGSSNQTPFILQDRKNKDLENNFWYMIRHITDKNNNNFGYHQISGRNALHLHALEYSMIEKWVLRTVEDHKNQSTNIPPKKIDLFKDVVFLSFRIYVEGISTIRSFFAKDEKTTKLFDELDKIAYNEKNFDIDYKQFYKTKPQCIKVLFGDESGYILYLLYASLCFRKLHIQYPPKSKDESYRQLMGAKNILSGHLNEINHYYRHLYQMVKIVANYDEKIITYAEKRKFLKMLRAQLTSDEQALLFYNWLSGYGSDWENKNNHFFTKYRMIHNINPDRMNIFAFCGKEEVIKMIKDTNPGYNEYDNDNLFEFEDKMN